MYGEKTDFLRTNDLSPAVSVLSYRNNGNKNNSAEENKMLLNGIWNFSFNGEPEIPMEVPGCFDASGKYRFMRGIGTYRTTADGGGLMELACDGVGLRASFFWDGKPVGTEVTAFAPVKLVFDAGAEGTHELKIVCDNTIDESCHSEFRRFYDFYGFGGIYRDITLRKLPSIYFRKTEILPDPDRGGIRLKLELSSDVPVAPEIDGTSMEKLPGGGEYFLPVPDPRLWSPESPVLHTLSLDCGFEKVRCRFGLRKIEAADGQLYLNGKRLKLAGVNRHDVWPETGSAIPFERMKKDLEMIKKAGFNMIRGAHYPQSQKMLDLADELGILVWDEILGWENPADSLTDPEFQAREFSALERMIHTSFNHPSILFWGFLNEGATDQEAARDLVGKLASLARKLDPTRLVTYASMYGKNDRCQDLVDIVSFNTYPGWYGGTHTFFQEELVRTELEGLFAHVRSTPGLSDKPILISEIGAAGMIGDHSGRRWSEEYQRELVECAVRTALTHPECSGILIWQFCNTPVDDNGRIMMRPRGYNNKGLVDEYRRPKQAWSLFPGLIEELLSSDPK